MSSPRTAIVIEDRVMVPRSALDHAGYRDWVKSDEYPERLRTAFVAGELLVEMTPESIQAHNQVKAALTAALVLFARAQDLGEVYPDGALVTNEEAGLSCEPDLTFVSWESFERAIVRMVPRADESGDYIEILGSPDLVVEVVSDSSVRKDNRLLRQAYARAGIREYWLIDARGDGIRFEILMNRATGFASSTPDSEAQPSVVLPGRWRLSRALNRAGHHSYTLDRI